LLLPLFVLFCLSDFSIELWTCSNNVVFCFILYCFLRLLFYIYLTIFSVQIPNVPLLICLLSISILYINRYRYTCMSVYGRLDYKLSHITRMFTLHDRQIKVITKLPNSEQSYKGKVKTHYYINRQNQSTTGKL
jgi:hypothetical protein